MLDNEFVRHFVNTTQENNCGTEKSPPFNKSVKILKYL